MADNVGTSGAPGDHSGTSFLEIAPLVPSSQTIRARNLVHKDSTLERFLVTNFGVSSD